MGTNRVIKTDNEIDVEGSNINLKATTDVTGDCNISNNLTVSGTVQGFTFPSDGTNGQLLSTNGSGTLGFIDAATGGGGGVDTIASAAEAASYTGTAQIIYVTSTEDVTFTSNLKDRLIFGKEFVDLIFQDCNLENCIVQHYDTVKFETTRTDGSTDVKIINCRIQAYGHIELIDTGNTSGNQIRLTYSTTRSSNFKATGINNSDVIIGNSNIDCRTLSATGSAAYHYNIDNSVVNTDRMMGSYDLTGVVLTSATGSFSSNNLKIKTNGTDKINSVYEHPLKVTGNIVQPQKTMASITAAATSSIVTSNTITQNLSFNTSICSTNYASFFSITSNSGYTNERIEFSHKGRYKVSLFVGGFYSSASYAVTGAVLYGTASGAQLPRFSLRHYNGSSTNSISFAKLPAHHSNVTTAVMTGSFNITNPATEYIFIEHEDIRLASFLMEIELIELD